jgi:MFS family permease
VLFSLLNATLARNISVNTATLFSPLFRFSLPILQTIAALIGALFGGLIADYIGRRPTLAISMTLYGVSMLLQAILVSEAIFVFKYIAEGLGWGIFLTLYSFVIWGDLSNDKNVAKLYSVGLIVFYATAAIGQLPSLLSEISDNGALKVVIIFLLICL